MRQIGTRSQITVLDGGMGRELKRMGAPFRQPEWSALSLIEAPDLVKKAHQSYAEAGSDILTTSNYAVVPFHIGEERFYIDGPNLTALAGKLAREIASTNDCRVAGSIPPLFGSYRPDLIVFDQAPALLKIIIDSLSPFVDLWLAETVSSIGEAQVIAEALSSDDRPVWIAYTLQDDEKSIKDTARLRSGEKVIDTIPLTLEMGVSAILFNCSQPEVMAPAVEIANQELYRLNSNIPIGVYANAFPPMKKNPLANSTLTEVREDLGPDSYLVFVEMWFDLGATIIGGCCGIGPEHIASIRKRWKI